MRNFALFIAITSLTGTVAVVGCSSNNNGGTAAATTTHTSTGGRGNTSSSSGNTTSTGTNTGTGGTSTGTGGSSSSGGECYAGTSGYTALTAAPTPKQMLNACAATDISAFVSACVTGTSQTVCNNWFAANVAGDAADGGAGTACGNCIFPADSMGNPTNTGATFSVVIGSGSSAVELFGPNYGGCIQLKDTTNGAACALAMDNTNDCEQQACALDGTKQCSDADFQTCITYVTSTGQGCAAAFNSQSACTADEADGGVAQTCSPGNGTDQAKDETYIINLFCGTG